MPVTINNCEHCGEIKFPSHRCGEDGFRIRGRSNLEILFPSYHLERVFGSASLSTIYAYYVCSRVPSWDYNFPNGCIGAIIFDPRFPCVDESTGAWVTNNLGTGEFTGGFKTRLDAELYLLWRNLRRVMRLREDAVYNSFDGTELTAMNNAIRNEEIAKTECQNFAPPPIHYTRNPAWGRIYEITTGDNDDD